MDFGNQNEHQICWDRQGRRALPSNGEKVRKSYAPGELDSGHLTVFRDRGIGSVDNDGTKNAGHTLWQPKAVVSDCLANRTHRAQ